MKPQDTPQAEVDEFKDFADADEEQAAGDPEIDWERLEEVAAIFAEMSPLEALKALYGEKLEIPA
jgi:hypothetical protein